MKSACAVVLFFGVFYVVSAQINPELAKKYEKFDVDKVLNNRRILGTYIKCLLNEGSCTAEGRDLKQNIPLALKGGCDKCNEHQKNVTEKVIRHLIVKNPEDWERLTKEYDPEGLYKTKYADLLEKVKEPVKNVKEPAKNVKETKNTNAKEAQVPNKPTKA